MLTTLEKTEIFDRAAADEPSALFGDGDNAIRWQAGERLNHLIAERCAQMGDAEAVVTEHAVLTFQELDSRANQLARYLLGQGIGSGDRVGLLFDKSADTYVALLAVMKVNAAYVPLDGGFPIERVRFIAGDAGFKAIVSMSSFREKLAALDLPHVLVDLARPAIDIESCAPLADDEVAPPADSVCYIIYTSGTTGNPKGVVIEHPSICNFVRVAAELYGYAPGDRVYQGMTIAFDFSVEEIWVPLMAGATLIPARPGASLVGDELSDFLREREITGMACCPTLLATIEEELPELRILLVGGEACPQNLVRRWHRPGRTILNTYGPTEATVTATFTELTPSKPVTIGRPLPTYSIVILDPAGGQSAAARRARRDRHCRHRRRRRLHEPRRADGAEVHSRFPRTREQHVRPHLPHRRSRPHQRRRRGRIPRPHRHPGQDPRLPHRDRRNRIDAAGIAARSRRRRWRPTSPSRACRSSSPITRSSRARKLSRGEIAEALRGRLPAYMVPAFLEELPFIPMLISSKADHKKLPKPKGPRCQGGTNFVDARNPRTSASSPARWPRC